MAKNRSKKRSTAFVPRSQRDALGAEGSPTPPRAKRVAGARQPMLHLDPNPPKATPKPVFGGLDPHDHTAPQVRTDSSTPHPQAHAPKPRRLGRNLAIAGGATAAVGGTGYLIHRHRQKELAMKSLVDPFAKAYPVAVPVPRSVRVAALLPTGKHLGHGQDLKHVRKDLVDPFSKGSVSQGLGMAARQGGTMPLMNPRGTKRVTVGPVARRMMLREQKVNSKIPDGARAGRRVA